MQFDKGYKSPLFITDTKRMEATIEDPFILITDMNVVNINELLQLFNEQIGKLSNNVVVIAPDITDNALEAFVLNKLQGRFNFLCIEAPYVGQYQKDFLQDIAILTGGSVISEDAGQRFSHATLEMLGRAKRITSNKDNTLIVGGAGTPEAIQNRVASLRTMMTQELESEYQLEKLRERIGKLTNGIAVIKVGGQTEGEMKDRKERALDAVSSTQAAVDEGIVPGGEVIYLTAREVLSKDNIAEKILYEALARPFKKLVENAGYDGGETLADLKTLKIGNGFDVTDGQFKDMISSGIIDPVKVSKSAILNAVSVAIQIMTTNTVIVNKPEEKK